MGQEPPNQAQAETAAASQQPAQQHGAPPLQPPATDTADVALLDAQIAEGMHNIDVIRCV